MATLANSGLQKKCDHLQRWSGVDDADSARFEKSPATQCVDKSERFWNWPKDEIQVTPSFFSPPLRQVRDPLPARLHLELIKAIT